MRFGIYLEGVETLRTTEEVGPARVRMAERRPHGIDDHAADRITFFRMSQLPLPWTAIHFFVVAYCAGFCSKVVLQPDEQK